MTPKAKVKPKPLAIPQDLLGRVAKRYKTRDGNHLVLLLRVPDAICQSGGFEVWFTGRTQAPSCVRRFLGDDTPEPVRASVTRNMAQWWARIVAHRNLVQPSTREYGAHRRSETRKELARQLAQQSVRTVVSVLQRPPRKPFAKHPPSKIPLPYVFVYDPRAVKRARKNQPTVFVVHQATCPQLDGRRRSVAKRGATWVVEQTSAELAVRDQMAEFEADAMGYDAADFTVHRCELENRR